MDDYGLFLVGVVVAGTLLTVLWFMAVYRDDLGHERREAKRKVFEQRLKDSHEKEKLRELAAESERRRERQFQEWSRDLEYRAAIRRYSMKSGAAFKPHAPLTPPVLYKSRSTSSQRSSRREGISFDPDSISDIAQAGYDAFQSSGDSTPSHSSHDSSSSHSSSSHSCSGSSSCSSSSSSCGSSSP